MRPIHVVTLAGLVGLAFVLAACNIAAPVYYLLHGPPRTPAVYILPDFETVVFVDDRLSAIARNGDNLRRRIADVASSELMRNEAVSMTIRPQDAMTLAKQVDRHKKSMAVDEIGKAVGARLVIYVEILTFRESVDGVTPRPAGACRVKVIDVVDQVRLFPDPEGEQTAYTVDILLPPMSAELYRSGDSLMQIYEMMAAEMGSEVAKIFYDHETKELGGSLNPR